MKTAPSPVDIPAEFIHMYHLNGLTGRYLHLPAPKGKKQTIVSIHGQHASIERQYSTSQFLNDYGEVYQPDMPGFGGMDSFYSIGIEPSYDAYADYLYTFLKSHNLTKDITFFALSFGSQVLTRMYQKYPETQKWAKKPISFVGFGSGSDFDVSKPFRFFVLGLSYVARTRLGCAIINAVVFNRLSLKVMLAIFSLVKAKMQSDNSQLKKDMIQMESQLWRVNDHRTHAATAIMMLRQDLRKYTDKKVSLNLINLMTVDDHFFNHSSVKSTFSDLYDSYEEHELSLGVHAPSMIADKQEVSDMVPAKTKKLLSAK